MKNNDDKYTDIRPIIDAARQNVPAAIILGSGASAAFGMPSMSDIAQAILEKIDKNEDGYSLFKEQLDKTQNLEKALDYVERNNPESPLIPKIASITWELINKQDLKIYNDVISEKLSLPLTQLLNACLRGNQSPPKIITTNYDRLAEYAVDQLNLLAYKRVSHYTGFGYGYIRYRDNEISRKPFHLGAKITKNSTKLDTLDQISVWKVHGSIDWFRINKSENLVCTQHQTSIIDGLSTEIITPGLEKYRRASREPYRTIITEADNSIENAHSCFAIGFGFRDEHIQEKLVTTLGKKNIPIVVLAMEITEEAKNIFLKDTVSNAVLIEKHGKGSKAYVVNKPNQGGIKEIEYEDSQIWNLDNFVNEFFGE